MHDVGIGVCEASRDVAPSVDVTPTDMATHGHTRQAKGQGGCERGKDRVGAIICAHLVDDDAHLVAARHLTAGEINHVAEQAAEGCAQDMQYFERPARSRHGPKASVRRPESCRRGAPSNRAGRWPA
jgi:hypothetical protein